MRGAGRARPLAPWPALQELSGHQPLRSLSTWASLANSDRGVERRRRKVPQNHHGTSSHCLCGMAQFDYVRVQGSKAEVAGTWSWHELATAPCFGLALATALDLSDLSGSFGSVFMPCAPCDPNMPFLLSCPGH